MPCVTAWPASPKPRLVLIGGDLPEAEVLELLRQIKRGWPEVGCLVLAERAAGRQMEKVSDFF